MAFSHGVKASMVVNSVDLSGYLKSTGLDGTIDTEDTTVLQPGVSAPSKSYIPGLKDGSFSCEGPFDPTMDSSINSMLYTTVAFTYGPAGTTTGLPKYTGNVILNKYSIKTDSGSAASWSADFQVTGGWTRGVF